MTNYLGGFFWDSIGVATALVVVFFAYYRWKLQYWARKNVPFIEPSIPWGNMENPLRRTVSPSDVFTNIYHTAKSRGWKYCGIYTMAKANLMIVDLDLVKQIMTKDFYNFVDRGFYYNEKDDPLSAHLFAIGGQKWRNLRAKLSPTFTSGKMKSMFQTLADCGEVLEKYVEGNINNEEGFDIKEILGKFSTDIIGSCAFGIECNSFKDPDATFRTFGKKIFENTAYTAFKFILASGFPNLAKALKVTTGQKDTSDFFRKVVSDTITYRKKNGVTRNDFLQLLIDIMDNDDISKNDGSKGDGRKLTMDEAAAQCFVFFGAGFETSSTTMTFALFELTQHPDIQDRVRDEIREVLAKHDNRITYDSLNELKYMKQVIDETLRIYSPVSVVTRVCGSDYKIPGEDVVIEKGIKVFIPIQGIHMDKEYYDNPQEFNPDRFSEENKAGRHQYAHIPFGEGPRICIGERFGIMQTKVGLTSLLRNFRVTLNQKTILPLKFDKKSFIPNTEGGIWVNLEKL